jgi:sigma-B regulation protein RsbU (phosphoserine phosphatase)
VNETPVVFQYQQALDAFRRGGGPAPLLKRMSELISLLDLTTTLNSGLAGETILDAALLSVMGEMQAARGCLLVRGEEDRYAIRASRGIPAGAPREAELGVLESDAVLFREDGRERAAFEAFGLDVLCPIRKGGRPIALLGLGPRADGRPYAAEDAGFLRSVAACAATPIENGLVYDELRRVNQRLSVKVFQLHNLFDISRELTSSFDEEAIRNLVTTTLMGQLLISRCGLWLLGPQGLELAHERGLPREEWPPLSVDEARPLLQALSRPRRVGELPAGPLRERLESARLVQLVPLSAGERSLGFLALGERLSGAGFGEEDLEFVRTLGRQALAALEAVRMHRIRVEKQRRDREMQIAREIQQSLFPRACPVVPGLALAARSEPCHEVGGDYYDVIPLERGRLALVVADVSGKGTPASILMASVHASLRALAGSAPPAVLMDRLNRFLYESTQANKYVTLFYAEVDPAARRLSYVNAGHVPPFWLGAGRGRERLLCGGPVLGLLEGVAFESEEVALQQGDVLAVVTDGVTESLSPADSEFGEERVFDALEHSRPASADEILTSLVAATHSWAGPAGCADDLTALVLKVLET